MEEVEHKPGLGRAATTVASRKIALREAPRARPARPTHRLALLRLPGQHRQWRRQSSHCRDSRAINPADCPDPPPSSQPTVRTPPPSSQPTESGVPKPETRAFGKSYTWDDGVRVTVGKPTEFQPSAYPVDEKSKRYLKFTVTVVNKSDKPLDLGLTYISVESNHEQAQDVFDSASGLRGPPTTKVLKGRESQFEVGFGVADPKDVVMEIAFHADPSRPSLLYST
jgi:hypothetical protein